MRINNAEQEEESETLALRAKRSPHVVGSCGIARPILYEPFES